MKSIAILALSLFVLVSCNQAPQQENNTGSENGTEQQEDGNQYFGVKISDTDAMGMDNLQSSMEGQKEMKAKVRGEVEDVCQKKGCWMTLKNTDGSTMRVTFKDYGFFVPMDISGQDVIIEGVARLDTTSIDDLKHYAEDAGASQEEIDAITEPEIDVVFEAEGVIVVENEDAGV